MKVELWAIITDASVGYSMASEVSFHSSDNSPCCNVSEWLKFKIVTVVIYYHELGIAFHPVRTGRHLSLTRDVRVSCVRAWALLAAQRGTGCKFHTTSRFLGCRTAFQARKGIPALSLCCCHSLDGLCVSCEASPLSVRRVL